VVKVSEGRSSDGDVVTANNVVDGPVSEPAAGILDVVVVEALGMLPLATVESASRGILSVAVGETLGMLTFATVESVSRGILGVAVGVAVWMFTLVTVGPGAGNNTIKKSNGLA